MCAGGVGMTGRVVSVTGWQNESAVSYSNYIAISMRVCLMVGFEPIQRSVAEVEWTAFPGKRNRYRVGHNGKVFKM